MAEENSQEIYQLISLYPEFVDPFSNGSAKDLLYITCGCENMELLCYLLEHDQYHTIADSAFTAVKETKSSMVLLKLLKDGRLDVKDLSSLTWYNDFVLKWTLRGLEGDLLMACWNGDQKAVKKMVFTGLDFEKFDVLLRRSRNHGKVLRVIRGQFLRSLGLPPDDTNLQRFLCLASTQMSTEEIVPYVKMRYTLQLALEHHLIPDAIDSITLLATGKKFKQPAFELLPSFCRSAWLFILYQAVSTISEISGHISHFVLLSGAIAFARHFVLAHYQQVQRLRMPMLSYCFDAASAIYFMYKIYTLVFGPKPDYMELDFSATILQYIILFILVLSLVESHVR